MEEAAASSGAAGGGASGAVGLESASSRASGAHFRETNKNKGEQNNYIYIYNYLGLPGTMPEGSTYISIYQRPDSADDEEDFE
eukprot:1436757-Heterocapsa_arctica.AAC.1